MRKLDVEVVLGVERIEEVGRQMARRDREANMMKVVFLEAEKS
jgi:hypothetical protein